MFFRSDADVSLGEVQIPGSSQNAHRSVDFRAEWRSIARPGETVAPVGDRLPAIERQETSQISEDMDLSDYRAMDVGAQRCQDIKTVERGVWVNHSLCAAPPRRGAP